MRDFDFVVFKGEDGSISGVQRRIFETFSRSYEVLGEIPLELEDLKILDFLGSFRNDQKVGAINSLLQKLIEGSIRIGKELK